MALPYFVILHKSVALPGSGLRAPDHPLRWAGWRRLCLDDQCLQKVRNIRIGDFIDKSLRPPYHGVRWSCCPSRL
jgi:hypothetical protein